MAKISIIIPVYNAEEKLERCLNAILEQTYKDFEAICVDDGSKDSSYEILKQYAQKDSRIKAFSQENHGPAYTRHFAISQSQGEFLMFCDADDWYEPSMVETMINAIETEDVDIVMCDTNIVNTSGKELSQFEKDHYNHKLKLTGKIDRLKVKQIGSINVVLWNKIFRKSIMEKYQIEYPQKYEHDDTMFFYKYIMQCNSYYGIDKCLYNYEIGSTNSIMGKLISHNNKKNLFDFIFAWQDLIDYTSKMIDDKNKTDFILKGIFSVICHFFDMLEKKEQKDAFNHLKNLINNNKILLENNDLKTVNNISDVKKFRKIINRHGISFAEKIFSIRNEYIKEQKRKVLTIFGFNIIIK